MKLKHALSFLFFTFLFALPQAGKAQDTIVMNSGERIVATRIFVGNKEIEFHHIGRDTSIDVVNITDIYVIRYHNGTIDTTSIHRPKPDTAQNFYFKGIEDADANYRARQPGNGMFAVTLIVSPIITLYPAIVCAQTPPDRKNLHIRDTSLYSNAEYMNAYNNESADIKNRRVWKSYVIAGVIWLIAAIFLIGGI
jgi:hypothetical protein